MNLKYRKYLTYLRYLKYLTYLTYLEVFKVFDAFYETDFADARLFKCNPVFSEFKGI